ncbi:MAG: hypothetical protein RIC95_11365 [Vicingaceae bacterium]
MCLVFLSISTYAQDVHYSQRLVQDREKNPTFLQNFEGKWQAYSAYRQQWAAVGKPFVTSTAQVVRKFRQLSSPFQFFVAAGFTNDQSGDVNLTANHFALHFGGQYLSSYGTFEAALTNQFVGKSLNLNGVTFPEQYDRNIGGFNVNLANSENLNSQSINYFNWNFGLAWSKQLNEAWQVRAGASVNNITEPQESFLGERSRKNRGYGVQLLAYNILKSSWRLEPYLAYYRAQKASELILGSALRLQTKKLGSVTSLSPFIYFRSGVSRTSDAFILGSRAQLGVFDLGLSYDVNISELELATQNRGGFEISLFYTWDYAQLKERRVPCVRY